MGWITLGNCLAWMTSLLFRCLKLDEMNPTSKHAASLSSWNREELQVSCACKQTSLFKCQSLPNRIIVLHGFHREGGRCLRPQHGVICILAQRMRWEVWGCSLPMAWGHTKDSIGMKCCHGYHAATLTRRAVPWRKVTKCWLLVCLLHLTPHGQICWSSWVVAASKKKGSSSLHRMFVQHQAQHL